AWRGSRAATLRATGRPLVVLRVPPLSAPRARVCRAGFPTRASAGFPAVAGPGGLQEGFAEARRASTRPPAFSEARPPSQKAASFAPVHCLYCRRRWTMVEHPDWLS
ncbi:unnamed protein product, partial [Prorocentrum cordatum]